MEKGFYVYRDGEWLGDDEHGWVKDLGSAACFFKADLARDIGIREDRQHLGIFVFEMTASPSDARFDLDEEPPAPVDDGSCDPLRGQRMDSADMGEC